MNGIERYDWFEDGMDTQFDGDYVSYADHAAEIARLRAELENAAAAAVANMALACEKERQADALRVDAERYRWLRQFTDQSPQAIEHLPCSDGDLIDAAIDAAMGADA